MDEDRAAQLRALLLQDLDWDCVLRMALRHGVMPLLYVHLNAICPEAVPRSAFERMQDCFHANARRNLFLAAQLLHLLNLFEANSIPAAPYKGPVLAVSVYGDLAFRPFTDLDIFVHKHNVPKAKEILISQGYQMDRRLTAAQEAAYLESQCEVHSWCDGGRIRVELQWAIAPRCYGLSLDPEGLWERLSGVSFAGTTVRGFSPEDSILIHCVHGYKHCWERLGLICDVAELIRAHPEMNWERVMERSKMSGSERITLLGLCLANDLLGAGLPERVARKVRDEPAVKWLARQVEIKLFQEPSRPPRPFDGLRFRLRARERWRDRVFYCLRRAITTTADDWAFFPLPDSLFPLYYPLRPIRLVGKCGVAAFVTKR